ncbi:MAG: KOW domain-containing RNA-binding protein [Lachnospiraceae bacterium]|nr:KOW domain-containing RNA-binding protein [Lachnospiraceae bacterium]
MENMTGLFARSLAGHDKGEIFVIISCDTEYAIIADGKKRTAQKPKRKNLKHLAVMKNKPDDEIRAKLLSHKSVSNEEIKYGLERFKKRYAEV